MSPRYRTPPVPADPPLTEAVTGGSAGIYYDRAGQPRDAHKTEGQANFSEMARQALLSLDEAKAREAQEAIDAEKAAGLAAASVTEG